MALTKYKLGDLIAQRREKYDGSQVPVRGVTREGFIAPKQSVDDLHLYNMFYMDDFVFNPARMEINSIALNQIYEKATCSSLYEVFYVTRPDLVDPRYLNLFIKRDEFARLCAFIGWGSAREYCRVADICNIEIKLPPIETQRKYVAIYEAMCENQRCYEAGLEDLKLACDAQIEQLMKTSKLDTIGNYIEQVDVRNNDMHGQDRVRGISTEKELIATKAKLDGVSLSSYKVINPGELAYVADTSRRGGKISIAQNADDKQYLLSSISIVFKCNDGLIPDYLMLFFTRNEFDRYARFNSWGSARETFDWAEMENVRIPIPTLGVQRSIADLFKAYNERKEINEELKQQIKGLCPILIKGSLEEASKA